MPLSQVPDGSHSKQKKSDDYVSFSEHLRVFFKQFETLDTWKKKHAHCRFLVLSHEFTKNAHNYISSLFIYSSLHLEFHLLTPLIPECFTIKCFSRNERKGRNGNMETWPSTEGANDLTRWGHIDFYLVFPTGSWGVGSKRRRRIPKHSRPSCNTHDDGSSWRKTRGRLEVALRETRLEKVACQLPRRIDLECSVPSRPQTTHSLE